MLLRCAEMRLAYSAFRAYRAFLSPGRWTRVTLSVYMRTQMLPEFYITSFVALDPVSSFFVLLTHAAQFTLPLAMLASAELEGVGVRELGVPETCLLYTSPSPRD